MSNAAAYNSPVVLLHWPDDADRRAAYAERKVPRLLLVPPGDVPPVDLDTDEDWARTTADPLEVHSRVDRLLSRVTSDQRQPHVDDNGLLWRGDRWVALGPMEATIARALVDAFGSLVTRDALIACWPAPSPSALGVQMLRLRKRVEPLGLTVQTVRGQGYVLK
ncbi:MAG: transcriptional regulator [Acidimicrobiia bacterium]